MGKGSFEKKSPFLRESLLEKGSFGKKSVFLEKWSERKRDDNKNKIWRFSMNHGGVGRGAERKIVQNAFFFMGNVMTIKF